MCGLYIRLLFVFFFQFVIIQIIIDCIFVIVIYIIELILKGHIDFFSVSHKQASNLCHKFEKKVAKNKRGKNNKDI